MKDDLPVGRKQERGPSTEKHHPPTGTGPGLEPPIEPFSEVRPPERRMLCVIRNDEREPSGSFYPAHNDMAISLFINPGRYGPPTISLALHSQSSQLGIWKKGSAKESLKTERTFVNKLNLYSSPTG